ncbi:uncharacterized protein LOC108049528 [Drosophila rhopaloa]|uniref:Uncharacterized protein n=1 Tax=Drosophila rhopaloa TaxID=1041015 RepID=A0ABM5J529_DRORH|nr:uncharacterized protein LOC108049528 [Drosophila rhopaloa]
MPISQQDLCRMASTPSCCPRFNKSHTSNTYFSYADQDLGRKFYGGGSSMEEPSCDHWQFCEKVPNRSEVEADSLGSPVGLVCSNTILNNPCGSSPKQQEANVLNFATYLKAFALIYVLPEVDWTSEKIDMLLEEGSDLFRTSSEMEQEQENGEDNKLFQPEIYTNEEKRIKRNFNLEGHTFTLALEPRYLGAGTKPLEQQPSHTIKNLRPVLLSFFKSSRYCLLLTRVGHLLIWRRKRVFFVLDVKGRRRDDLQTVVDNGVAMLVCLKTIDNVVHLASNLSGISPEDGFTIRELVVVRLETPDGRIYMRDTSHRSIEFKVVNKSYAYLKGTLHLSLNQNDPVRNRSSLMVAVGSILASKIDHPANWDTNMLDRLICYGVELCRNCWADCLRDRRPIDLDTFPTQLRMGQYVLELKLIPNVRTGHWKCGVRIIGTDFQAHVLEALKEYGNVVFQINNQMYAMWAKDEFYYLLDPYRHTIVGTHVDEDKADGVKWATVRMFRDQLTMLSVFHQLLMESNRQSAYYLHVIRIRNLAECPEGYALAPSPEDVDNHDVKSLNEPIFFNEQQGVSVCDRSLAEISDYEEDVVSLTDDKFDIKKFKILEDKFDVERQNAGEECEMCEEEMETKSRCRCPGKKRINQAKSDSRVQTSKRSSNSRCECRCMPIKNNCLKTSTKSRKPILKKEQEKRETAGNVFLKEKRVSPEIPTLSKKNVEFTRPIPIKGSGLVRSSRQTGGASSNFSPSQSPERSKSKEGKIIRKYTKISRQTGGRSSTRSRTKSPKCSRSKDGLSPGRINTKILGKEALSNGLSPKVDFTQGSTARETGGRSSSYTRPKSPVCSKSRRGSSPGRTIIKRSHKGAAQGSIAREMGGRSSNHSPTKCPVRSKSPGSTTINSFPKKEAPGAIVRGTGDRSSSPSPANSPVRFKSRQGSSPGRITKKIIKISRESGGRTSSPSPQKSPQRSRSKEGSSSGRPMKKMFKTLRQTGTKSQVRSTSREGSSPGRTTIEGSLKGPASKGIGAQLAKPKEKTLLDTATKLLGNAVTKVASPKLIVNKDEARNDCTNGKGGMLLKEALIKMTAVKESPKRIFAPTDILQQSADKPDSLGVAPVATAHLITPAASGLSRDLDQETSSLPNMEFQNIEDFNEHPEECCCSCRMENPTENSVSQVAVPRFPGFNRVPQLLAVAGSESGTVESLNRLLGSAFKVANRVLTMTPWGNYVVFRHHPTHMAESAATWFYVFDGCTCDIDRFRHLDLSKGTAGLIAFRKQSEVVCHIIDSREEKALNMLATQVKDPPHKRLQKLLAR